MNHNRFDIIVIGGGPGGYVAAIKAAQLGFKTACIDQRRTLGGTCLNVGCIPSKALLHSSQLYYAAQYGLKHHGIDVGQVSFNLKAMMARKDKIVSDLTSGIQYLFKKNNVTFIEGRAAFVNAQTVQINDQDYQANHFIVATGSKAMDLPNITVDEATVVSSTGALSLTNVPQHLVVIGGGYIGLELGSVWNRLGAKVTVVEYAEYLLPAMDRELGQALTAALIQQGITLVLNTQVRQVEKINDMTTIKMTNNRDNQESVLTADVVLSCIGRQPYTKGMNLDAVGIKLDNRGFIPVDENYQTIIPTIYAVGDVIQGPMLAHKAEDEGITCVERIAGQKSHVNYALIPAVIYTHPEVASVGRTEETLRKLNHGYKVGRFPFTANARAKATDTDQGFVKVLTDAVSDEILGVHIIHSEAGTMIAECALAMEYRASGEDIARTIHAHPTINEVFKEAAMSAYDRAIHN